VPEGLLQCREALVLNTSNTAAQREQAVFGDPLERIWCDCILKFCGISRVRRRMFETVVTSAPEQRRAWLQEAAGLAAEIFPGK
jgi:putative NADPH-quinone reductase